MGLVYAPHLMGAAVDIVTALLMVRCRYPLLRKFLPFQIAITGWSRRASGRASTLFHGLLAFTLDARDGPSLDDLDASLGRVGVDAFASAASRVRDVEEGAGL